MHWSSWKPICLPWEEGGIGVRSLADLVKAFSIKLWFRFREQASLWATCLFTKYCKSTIPPLVNVKPANSMTWKRMLEVKDFSENNLFWAGMKGKVYFWHDKWSDFSPLYSLARNNFLSTDLLIDYGSDNGWDWGKLSSNISPHHAASIFFMPFDLNLDAKLLWKPSSDGSFNVKSA